MAYELFVSLRHLKAKRTQKFISLNTWISIGGVALGVMALIVVIAVMSGFGKDLRDKILGTTSHAVITNINRSGIENVEDIIRQVKEIPGVTAAAPFIMNHVMLTHGASASGVVVRGVDVTSEAGVSDLEKNLIAGSLDFLKTEKSPGKSSTGKISRAKWFWARNWLAETGCGWAMWCRWCLRLPASRRWD